jgi:acyl transferase domain-containing protein
LFCANSVAWTSTVTGTNYNDNTHALKMDPVVAFQIEENVSTPIAIVGMAVRLPGGVRSTADFWQMLSGGQDGRCVVPGSRYNEGGFYSESGAHSVGTRHGYFLQDDLETVDTSFFDMDGLQPPRMDPQQKLLLQVVWDCLENAGQVKWRGRPIGCFVGTFGGDWEEIETKDTQNAHNFHLIGRGKFALANVVSYEFDFKGPRSVASTMLDGTRVKFETA